MVYNENNETIYLHGGHNEHYLTEGYSLSIKNFTWDKFSIKKKKHKHGSMVLFEKSLIFYGGVFEKITRPDDDEEGEENSGNEEEGKKEKEKIVKKVYDFGFEEYSIETKKTVSIEIQNSSPNLTHQRANHKIYYYSNNLYIFFGENNKEELTKNEEQVLSVYVPFFPKLKLEKKFEFKKLKGLKFKENVIKYHYENNSARTTFSSTGNIILIN
jgi:hypothetical protein